MFLSVIQRGASGCAADWFNSATSVQPGVYKLYTNDHICTRGLHARISCGMGPCFWSLYASGVLYSIYNGASKLVGFTAGDPANKCIGFAADSAARRYIGFTADGAERMATPPTGPTNGSAFRPTPH